MAQIFVAKKPSTFKTDVGDMELNASTFNNAMGTGGGMGESYEDTATTDSPLTFAIISSYCEDCPDYTNRWKYSKLVSYASKYGDDYVALRDTSSLLILGIDLGWAMFVGERFDQNSIIFSDENGCDEICTKPFGHFKVGDVIQEFSIKGIDYETAEKLLLSKKG